MARTLAEKLDAELVRGLVSKAITCPITGEVLDVRTCVVLEDSDSDPKLVLSQDGWKKAVASGRDTALAKHGITVRSSTVRS